MCSRYWRPDTSSSERGPSSSFGHFAMSSHSPYASSIISSKPDSEFASEYVRPKPRTTHLDLLSDTAGVTWEVLDRQYAGRGTPGSPFLVEFLPDDPHNPYQFPRWKKWVFTVLHAVATLAVALSSSAFSGSAIGIIIEYHIAREIAILGVSLFVLGEPKPFLSGQLAIKEDS